MKGRRNDPVDDRSYDERVDGRRFGRLTVLYTYSNGTWARWGRCACDCGNMVNVRISSLNYGCSKSCGCFRVDLARERMTTHGKYGIKAYRTWVRVMLRANPKHKSNKNFKYWAGRGLGVCDRWKSFENFYQDMGDPPTEAHSIDRIDNDKGYEPGNCRWATCREQGLNKRNTALIHANGKSMTAGQWAEVTGIKEHTIWMRFSVYKWSPSDAVNTPVLRNGQRLKEMRIKNAQP